MLLEATKRFQSVVLATSFLAFVCSLPAFSSICSSGTSSLFSPAAFAQDVLPESPAQAPLEQNRTEATKTNSQPDKPAFTPANPTDTTPKGITFVSLDPSLERLYNGDDPKTLSDLKSLQAQQSKVADKIHLVTVNLQHGSTQGSGVIINEDGFILTAAHVAGRPKQRMTVVLHDGRRVEGISLGLNRDSDAGLVRIVKNRDNGKPWPHASMLADATVAAISRSTVLRAPEFQSFICLSPCLLLRQSGPAVSARALESSDVDTCYRLSLSACQSADELDLRAGRACRRQRRMGRVLLERLGNPAVGFRRDLSSLIDRQADRQRK